MPGAEQHKLDDSMQGLARSVYRTIYWPIRGLIQ